MAINLTSDTVTKPTEAMLSAMFRAEVGDDVYGEDPTTNQLQDKVAALFNKEAALFCPSGTMTNQIAIGIQTGRLEEVICHEYSHIYQYEAGGYASNSGTSIKLLDGPYGKITPAQIEAAINPEYDWLPRSTMVVIENTCNKGGGIYYTLAEMQAIHAICQQRNIRLHLDGARLFNAIVETGDDLSAIGAAFDSISICLSKGLGAPIGSLLVGSTDLIREAKRLRKAMGGGMRQVGYLAAAGIYALDHHIDRLRDDHRRARILGETLEQLPFVENIRPIQTNIVFFDVKAPFTAERFLVELLEKGVKASPYGPQTVRFVTHLDFTEAMLDQTVEALRKISTP